MIWQDVIIAAVQAGFVAFLWPTVLDVDGKPPLTTSVPTAAGLAIIAVCMGTLELWWSMATAGACALLWLVIAGQRARGRR